MDWTQIYTRMHSSRMRTGRTLTVFRKLETPPKIWSRHPPKKIWSRHPPRKFGAGTPPKIWSRPPRKFGAGTPPQNLEQAPPRKYGADTPPVDRMTHASENITLAKTSFRPVINDSNLLSSNLWIYN